MWDEESLSSAVASFPRSHLERRKKNDDRDYDYLRLFGAGKTTLIKKLLEEAFQGEKIVLIENEFGEIGIDGGFLKDAGIQVKRNEFRLYLLLAGRRLWNGA